jgi:ADP-ribose pyrophosphatase YjhB (NUDIX family)
MPTLGAFAVIFDEEARILLCHRTDRDMWNLPGGRVEKHEAPWDAVVREVEEETGLHVQVEKLIGVYAVPQKEDLVFNFLCRATAGALRHSRESDRLGWFSSNEVPTNTLPRHIERIKHAYSGLHSVRLEIQT